MTSWSIATRLPSATKLTFSSPFPALSPLPALAPNAAVLAALPIEGAPAAPPAPVPRSSLAPRRLGMPGIGFVALLVPDAFSVKGEGGSAAVGARSGNLTSRNSAVRVG